MQTSFIDVQEQLVAPIAKKKAPMVSKATILLRVSLSKQGGQLGYGFGVSIINNNKDNSSMLEFLQAKQKHRKNNHRTMFRTENSSDRFTPAGQLRTVSRRQQSAERRHGRRSTGILRGVYEESGCTSRQSMSPSKNTLNLYNEQVIKKRLQFPSKRQNHFKSVKGALNSFKQLNQYEQVKRSKQASDLELKRNMLLQVIESNRNRIKGELIMRKTISVQQTQSNHSKAKQIESQIKRKREEELQRLKMLAAQDEERRQREKLEYEAMQTARRNREKEEYEERMKTQREEDRRRMEGLVREEQRKREEIKRLQEERRQQERVRNKMMEQIIVSQSNLQQLLKLQKEQQLKLIEQKPNKQTNPTGSSTNSKTPENTHPVPKPLKQTFQGSAVVKNPAFQDQSDQLSSIIELKAVENRREQAPNSNVQKVKQIKTVESKKVQYQKPAKTQQGELQQINLEKGGNLKTQNQFSKSVTINSQANSEKQPPKKQQLPTALPPRPPAVKQPQEEQMDLSEVKEKLNMVGETIGCGSRDLKGIEINWMIPCFFLYRKFYQLRLALLRQYLLAHKNQSVEQNQIEQIKEQNQKVCESLTKMAAVCERKCTEPQIKAKLRQPFEANVSQTMYDVVQKYTKTVQATCKSLNAQSQQKVKLHLLQILNSLLIIQQFEGKEVEALDTQQLSSTQTKKQVNKWVQQLIQRVYKNRTKR